MVLFRALRGRAFSFLWAGQTVSALGDWLYRIALVWWAMENSGSGAALGTVAMATAIPQVLLLLVGGVIVDRIPRVRIMLISDVARCVLTAVLAALVLTDRLGMGLVYAFSFGFGFVDSFVGPAFNALVPEIVAAEDLPSANSLNTLGSQLCGIGGPALGAVLVASGGTALAFVIDSLTFLISAVCVWALGRSSQPLPRASVPDDDDPLGLDAPTFTTVTMRATGADFLMAEVPAGASMLGEMREGLKVVRSEPWLWVAMLCVNPSFAVYTGLMSVSLPFMIKNTLGLHVGSLSIVQGAAAAGAVIAAVWLGRRGRLRWRGPFLYINVVIMGGCMIAMGLSTSILVLAVGALLCNGALNAMNLVWFESVQSSVPQDLRGRVASIDAAAVIGLMPIGFFLAGWAADHAPPAQSFVIGGVIVAALALIGLAHPRIRRFD